MNTLRVTIKVEAWTGPAATHTEVAKTLETSDEDPIPQEYANLLLSAMMEPFERAVTLAGGTVREIVDDEPK